MTEVLDDYGKPIPRRCFVDRMTPAELAIREAMRIVEEMGADVRLTRAVILLGKAQDAVADFVDGVPYSDATEPLL